MDQIFPFNDGPAEVPVQNALQSAALRERGRQIVTAGFQESVTASRLFQNPELPVCLISCFDQDSALQLLKQIPIPLDFGEWRSGQYVLTREVAIFYGIKQESVSGMFKEVRTALGQNAGLLLQDEVETFLEQTQKTSLLRRRSSGNLGIWTPLAVLYLGFCLRRGGDNHRMAVHVKALVFKQLKLPNVQGLKLFSQEELELGRENPEAEAEEIKVEDQMPLLPLFSVPPEPTAVEVSMEEDPGVELEPETALIHRPSPAVPTGSLDELQEGLCILLPRSKDVGAEDLGLILDRWNYYTDAEAGGIPIQIITTGEVSASAKVLITALAKSGYVIKILSLKA